MLALNTSFPLMSTLTHSLWTSCLDSIWPALCIRFHHAAPKCILLTFCVLSSIDQRSFWYRWYQHWCICKVLFHLVECYLAFFIPLVRIVLPEHFENRVTLGRHLRDEMGYVVEPSHKASNFFLSMRGRQVLYCSYFVQINLDSFLANYET